MDTACSVQALFGLTPILYYNGDIEERFNILDAVFWFILLMNIVFFQLVQNHNMQQKKEEGKSTLKLNSTYFVMEIPGVYGCSVCCMMIVCL